MYWHQAQALMARFQQDECFRKAILSELGEEFRDYFTDPEKLSRLLAEIGVTAATGGLSLASSGLNGAGKLGKLAKLLERFLPERDGRSNSFMRGRTPGEVLSRQELENIQEGLLRNGTILLTDSDKVIDVDYGRNKAAVFTVDKQNRSIILTRQSVTRNELFHEIRHHNQYRRQAKGDKSLWDSIGEESQERYVYDYMRKQRWLTPEELKQARFQMDRFRKQ